MEFWQSKFASNIERDLRKQGELTSAGWRVAIVWECALRNGGCDGAADELLRWLKSKSANLDIGDRRRQQVW